MNKTQLVDALAARLGDRHLAASAVDGLLETIVDTVRSGDSVSLTGFGVFESRARAARLGRNPRTGEPVEVPAATVPAFRPGTGFRTAVGGAAVARAATRGPAPQDEPAEAPAKPSRKVTRARADRADATEGGPGGAATNGKSVAARLLATSAAGGKPAKDKPAGGKSAKDKAAGGKPAKEKDAKTKDAKAKDAKAKDAKTKDAKAAAKDDAKKSKGKKSKGKK